MGCQAAGQDHQRSDLGDLAAGSSDRPAAASIQRALVPTQQQQQQRPTPSVWCAHAAPVNCVTYRDPVFVCVAGPAGWVDRFGAGKARKGCDILVQALEREGVDTGGECGLICNVDCLHSSSRSSGKQLCGSEQL